MNIKNISFQNIFDLYLDGHKNKKLKLFLIKPRKESYQLKSS